MATVSIVWPSASRQSSLMVVAGVGERLGGDATPSRTASSAASARRRRRRQLLHRLEVADERLPDGGLNLAGSPGGLAEAGEGVDHRRLARGAQRSGSTSVHGTGERVSAPPTP